MKIATELMQTNHTADKVSTSLILPRTCMLFLLISSLGIILKSTLYNFWLQTLMKSRHVKKKKKLSRLPWWSGRSLFAVDGAAVWLRYNRSYTTKKNNMNCGGLKKEKP